MTQSTPSFFESLLAFLRLASLDLAAARLAWDIKRQKKTYLSYGRLASLARNFHSARQRSTQPLQIAEFGVGRGGSALLLHALAQRHGAHLALFDLFGQIPSPGEQDGEQARQRYQAILQAEHPENYYGNIPDLLQLIRSELAAQGSLAGVAFIIGRYEDSLPQLNDRRAFNLVHIDCDWYESTRTVLEYLRPNLHPAALIQVDDYGHWEGARKAVDQTEWLANAKRWRVDQALVIDLGG